MTTYRTPSLSLEEDRVPERTIAYFIRRLQHEVHELVVREFFRLEAERNFTKSRLAERLNKDPAQITKWLSAPRNWTLETLGTLLVGMGVDPRRAVASLHKPAQSPQFKKIPGAQEYAQPPRLDLIAAIAAAGGAQGPGESGSKPCVNAVAAQLASASRLAYAAQAMP